MSVHDVRDRYQRDPKFKQIVDLMVAHMMQNKIAPDEIRDAAFVASIIFMDINPARSIVLDPENMTVETKL